MTIVVMHAGAPAGEKTRTRALLGKAPSEGQKVEAFEVQSATNPQRHTASPLVFVAVFVSSFCPLLFGFAVGFTSPAQAPMLGTMRGTTFPPISLVVFTPSQFTMYAAIMTIGAIVGSFAGFWAMDRIGRRRALALSACPHVVAWCGTIIVSDPSVLIVLRWLTGFAVGMGASITPSYIGEVSTLRLRGPLGATFQLVLNLGTFSVSLAGAYGPAIQEVGGHLFCNWRRLSVFGLVFSVILLLMLCMPESPKWLAEKGRMQDAKLTLRRLRRGDTTAEEAQLELNAERPSASTLSLSTSGTLGHSLWCYKQSMVVAVGLMAFQQFSGINPVVMYAADICAQTGMGNAEAASMGIMGMQVLLTIVSCVLVETAGRRWLIKMASMIMCFSHIGLAYYMAAEARGWWTPSWLGVVCLCTYIFSYCTGMGPVPWLLLAEIFPVEVRGAASAMATSVGWISAFAMLIGFRSIQAALGSSGVFALFAVFCFFIFLFVCAVAPETRGKTVEQIVEELNGPAAHTQTPSRSHVEDCLSLSRAASFGQAHDRLFDSRELCRQPCSTSGLPQCAKELAGASA